MDFDLSTDQAALRDAAAEVLADRCSTVRVRAVAETGEKLARAAWVEVVPRRASLVVAALDGGSGWQTWEGVALALHAALQVVADGGAIAVCTELTDPPGPAVQTLALADDRDEVLRQIVKHRPADALPLFDDEPHVSRSLLDRDRFSYALDRYLSPGHGACSFGHRIGHRFDMTVH